MALLIFIFILVALIWVHELGHFTAAKLFGIRVDEFGIGFPPRLLRLRWGETDYTFNLLLVGGFVRIHGEDPGTSAHDSRSMASKPRVVQALVIVAGVAMNLVLAWLVLSAGYMSGMPASPANHRGFGEVQNVQVAIAGVLPSSPAQRAGIMAGDTIEKITSATAEFSPKPGSDGATTQEFITAHQDESLVFSVARHKEELTFLVRPEAGIVADKKVVGIQMQDIGVLRLPVHLSLLQGAISAKDLTVSTARGLGGFFGQLFRGAANWSDVSGPVGIAGVGASAVEQGFSAVALITALISINLAIINLLPIPGLDGGRLLIIIIESIIRRPVSPRLITGLSLVGFALIITLMVAVTYHDIARLVG